MKMRLLTTGFAIWAVATIYLRLDGKRVLHARSQAATLLLFLLSFVAMAWLTRRLCRKARLSASEWPAAAISLALPTLLLDPVSAAFFPSVFPNIQPEMAGVFGGWMLVCCAGALIGVLPLRRST
jgi:uncharacterized protein DUF5367